MKVILFVSVILFSCNISAASLSTALTLNGLQWAQLTDTEYLYVPDVYAACGNSGGECSGTVGGKDLAGWRWASTDEVNVMFYELLPRAGVKLLCSCFVLNDVPTGVFI